MPQPIYQQTVPYLNLNKLIKCKDISFDFAVTF